MPLVITPSAFSSYTQCSYRWKNSVYNVDPLNTIHGNLANAAANAAISKGANKLGSYIRYYEKIINPMLPKKKQLSMDAVKKGLGGIYNYLKQFATEEYQIWQEQKLEFPYEQKEDDIVRLSGTPDVVILHNEPKEEYQVEIIDIKCGTLSWYDGPEIWRENAQWYFYPWFILQHWLPEIKAAAGDNKVKIKFTFLVMDKKTGEVRPFSKVMDIPTIETNVNHNIKGYIDLESQNLEKDQYPAKECRACKFCPLLDVCPLKRVKDEQEKEVEDLFE